MLTGKDGDRERNITAIFHKQYEHLLFLFLEKIKLVYLIIRNYARFIFINKPSPTNFAVFHEYFFLAMTIFQIYIAVTT